MEISKGYAIVLSIVFTPALTHCQPNILVDATGHARITDFGLTTVTRSPDSVSSADQGHATRWAAPEILKDEGTYSKEADVFLFVMVVIEVGHKQVICVGLRLIVISCHRRYLLAWFRSDCREERSGNQ